MTPHEAIWGEAANFLVSSRLSCMWVNGNWESYCLTRCAQVVSRWKHWVCHRERMVHEAECGTPCGGKIPRGFVVLRLPAALHCLTPPWGRFPEKKVAVLLDFVQMRGGRALPKFFVHFSQTVYIGSIWGWGGRGRPLPKFFGTLAFKKSGTSCPN